MRGPAPRNSHERLTEQCAELPQRTLTTDVNADDLECWWFEMKLYARSRLHERSRRGKGIRAKGVGVHYTQHWPDRACIEAPLKKNPSETGSSLMKADQRSGSTQTHKLNPRPGCAPFRPEVGKLRRAGHMWPMDLFNPALRAITIVLQ